MKTIAEVEEKLKETPISIQYKGWLQYIKRHFQRYGEKPEVKEVNFKYIVGNVKDRCNGGKIIQSDKTITYHLKNGEIVESDSTYNCLLIKDAEEYKKYESYMPFNIYVSR